MEHKVREVVERGRGKEGGSGAREREGGSIE